jgi:PPK2 family polyphosphate:nucleotide phosphotransferase
VIDPRRFLVEPGQAAGLAARATAETLGLDRDAAEAATADNIARANDLQEALYAEGKQSVLFVFQAMDAAGKDSTTQKVFGPLNPQGVTVASFKAPTTEELSHDFLWRVHEMAPPAGMIRVFNRSHFEDVLIVRVHGWATPEVIERRYEHIRAFERLLVDRGTRIVKVMLHISPAYQLERFKRRLRKPDKQWKFNPADLKERAHWDAYMDAFERAMTETSTQDAPWYVVPAEERWFRDLVVSQLIVDVLEDMNPQYPPLDYDPADYPPDSLQ